MGGGKGKRKTNYADGSTGISNLAGHMQQKKYDEDLAAQAEAAKQSQASALAQKKYDEANQRAWDEYYRNQAA